ncbi:hypothetical protein [Sulfurivirga sp.]|uniref:SLAC1 family transporter n=1 Tax=Sulfurivirga sp. TaxID=2614236 RepID=UPI0025D5F5F2|nr:hypothetical protein [Sulfurivirga sp.]
MKTETPTVLFFPSITYFAMPMALLAMAVNLRHLAALAGWDGALFQPVMAYGLLALLLLSVFYFQHLAGRGRETLVREWCHPFQLSFFPLMSISWFFTAYFAAVDLPQYPWLGRGLFWGVLVWHGLLNLFLINRWLFDHQLTLDHLRPTWFILLSGDFIAVLTGREILGHEAAWMWLFFSAALFMWFMFATLLLYRLIFVTPIEEQYRPSLFIFLAPPSLASVAAHELFATPWHLSVWGPYAFASFMLGVWIISGRRFLRNGISMTSWSYIFPLAAYGLANQYLYESTHQPLFLWVALAVLGGMVLLAGLITGWLMRVAIENIRSKFA